MVHGPSAAGQTASPLTLFTLPAETLRGGYGINWLDYVGLAERARAAEFSNPDEALAFAAQHTLMRAIAASVLGVKPTAAANIPVDRTCLLCADAPTGSAQTHGKPRIDGVNLSMARSLGLVAGALAPADVAVGLDVIAIRGSYYDSFDRIALADYEKRVVASLAQSEASVARHLLWSAKEAVLKASGYGLAVEPSRVMLSLPPISSSIEDSHGLTARAVAHLPGGEAPATFWLTWQVYHGTHLLAVASDTPHRVMAHTVTTPLAVKRVLGA
ncbi:hypothetical protein A7979_03950 [Rothia nasimurium]|uniref:4'-phosphopantetheinyl transferase domain-containing protein n=1 Tax=Rothia nasimurium TaxID=85336 RepID=A0A1Y1RPU1_9MICC|nr:4'-phosphopantetheinyl transferase superfamily protein [Rothia nasimurium]ORC16480.1 hypothetical protein A7979_03950 [Rothia nasimurium]